MKRNKKLTKGKPYQMTARCPENRQGTKTARGYILHMTAGNGHGLTRAAVLATRRQEKKALNAWYGAKGMPQHQGRVIRAGLRCIAADFGAECDRLYYGHP